MKLTTSAFCSDHLKLSRWELFKLFWGFTLRDGALVVSTRKKK